jgi:peptidylprolyl isomerase
MTQAKRGDTVQIHYTGTLADGSVFDSSDGRDPLEFAVGSGMIIPGLDVAIPGMAVGDKKVVEVPADQAYGPVHPEARQPIPRSELPSDIPQEVGTRLQMQNPEGQVIAVVIVEVTETEVIIDANHPLAGKDLTFAIEMVGIQPA